MWRYRYLEGVGRAVSIKFVDTCQCDGYRLTDRHHAISHLLAPEEPPPVRGGLFHPPQTRHKDLEDLVTHHVKVSLLPFDVRTDFARLPTRWPSAETLEDTLQIDVPVHLATNIRADGSVCRGVGLKNREAPQRGASLTQNQHSELVRTDHRRWCGSGRLMLLRVDVPGINGGFC